VTRRARGEAGTSSTGARARLAAVGIAALCASLLVLAIGASSALANRSFVQAMTGFNGAFSVAIESNDHVWVTDRGQFFKNQPGQNGIYRYTPFPSEEKLAMPSTFSTFSFYILDLSAAVDDATGEVFVAQSNGRSVSMFAPLGGSVRCRPAQETPETYCFTHNWTKINGANTCFNCFPDIHVAIDNTNTYSKGRVYLSLTSPENYVEAFDAQERAVDYPATAPYIENNKITGTPSGSFGQVGLISVDNNGNIYVTDAIKKVVDEFDSTGTFVRSFPDPRAEQGYPGTGGAGVDPTNGNVLIDESVYNNENGEGGVKEFDSSGNYLETLKEAGLGQGFQTEANPAVNSNGYVYVPTGGSVSIFSPTGVVPKVTYKPVTSPTTTAGTLNATIDPNGGEVTECDFEYGINTSYGSGKLPCQPATHFGTTADVSAELTGLTTATTYHYRVVAHDANGVKYGADQTYTPSEAVGLTTEPATEVTEAGATFNASFVGNGEETHYYFEWGRTEAYVNKTAVAAVSPGPGSAEALSAKQEALAPFSTYHYRVVATNGPGGSKTSYGADQMFTTPPGVPTVVGDSVTLVHAERAVFHGEVNPNGGETTVGFQYIPDAAYQANLAAGKEGFTGASRTAPGVGIGMSKHVGTGTETVNGLQPGTRYHFRAVGTSAAGEGVAGFDNTFVTFPFQPEVDDHCPNGHVRQQTGTSQLLDCRAYELVSAANAGGYDVESSLVPGQTPFDSLPEAQSPSGEPRVLYGVHDGGIPGNWNPTNRGVDPYVATRGANGWSTDYVGIPANGTPSTTPFSSTLAEPDASLGTFAFGGSGLCSPCFSDGSTGNPIHLPNGELVQGMAGSLNPNTPGNPAKPAGFIGKHLSADGTHFVFGSTSQFEPDGNSNGDLSIYDRNLNTGITHVVSKTTNDQTMTGAGIGELDISKDGSRIVVGQLVSESGEAKYWHLYMNIGDAGQTVDLTPGTTSGAMYDGMTEDGSKVFFTTTDQLLTADSDHSADIYAAEVDPAGNVTLKLISTKSDGTPSNNDSCDPTANTVQEHHWNTTGEEENCGVVAVGGSGGVAGANGTIYFLSPEQLDGSNGTQNAPNLYVARPGSSPHFIATLESTAQGPLPPKQHSFVRYFGAFANATGVTVDHATGDIYVLDAGIEIGQGYVFKFTPQGKPVLTFGHNGKLIVSGMLGFYSWPTQIAVDNDPTSPSYRDFYVPELDIEGGQFNIEKYGPEGEHLATLESFFPLGVSVDPANGNLYVASYYGYLLIYTPEGKLTTLASIGEKSPEPEGVSVDSAGNAYVVNGGGQAERKGTTELYHPEGGEANWIRTVDKNPSYGVAVDQADENVFVDEGKQVREFDSSGTEVGAPSGLGVISDQKRSTSLAADSDTLEVSNPGASNAVTLGPLARPYDPHTDNPLVIDSVSSPATRHTGDFAVTPSGNDAVFTSTESLTGYNTGLIHREVYRYDESSGIECPSCNSTEEQAAGEASLPPNGLGLSNDGRVFFNSTEGLVDRDLNEQEDAYEWEPKGYEFGNGAPPCETNGGCVQLISSGSSPFAARLAGISSNGTDAYFFTREKLVEQDENGNSVRIYDARSLGGVPFISPEPQCKASDECHGPGTQQPPVPNIKSFAETPGGNLPKVKCKKGFVERHGKCVRAHHKHHKNHRRRRHHHGGRRHG
jgi:hypothetical protein